MNVLKSGLVGMVLLSPVVLSASASAEVQVKASVEEVRIKSKPTSAQMKDPKAMMRMMEKKVLDQRTLNLTYGTAKELLLPNGNKMMLTAVSYNAQEKTLKVHVRMQVQGSGYDSDVSLHQHGAVPFNGGPYDKHVLMVYLTVEPQ